MIIQYILPHQTLRRWIIAIASVLCLSAAARAADAAPLDSLRAEMRAERYEQAGVLADKIIAAKDAKADEAHYFKALALFHTKKFAAAVTEAGVSFLNAAFCSGVAGASIRV